jgi:lysophospholipase L1-like esterase
MSMIRRVGRTAITTAIATAATATIGGAVVLAGQAVLARGRRYAQPDLRLAMRASVGGAGAVTIRLVLLGDSTALGVGVERVTDTVGGQLATLLADSPGGRRVELSSVAVSGARSADLGTQVARALLGARPDVAVILVGGNDAMHFTRPSEAAEDLASAVRRLRALGVGVVAGTTPDLGATRAFARPLRQLVNWQGRRLARAQIAAVRSAGGTPVDLAAQTGAVFRADTGTYCHDGYHPSADGYRVWAHALLPAVTEVAAVAQ